jgi:hypothetical protein
MSGYFDLSRTFAEIERNSHEVLRMRIDEFNGRTVVDLRSWFRAADGELKPGRTGLTLSVRHLEKLAEGFGEALRHARRAGMLNARR